MEDVHHKNLCDLSDAILSLETKNDLDRFLIDLCTPSEIRALKERWLVCQLLDQGKLSYREIKEETKVSLSTIVRVARFLREESNHGYKIVLEKINNRR